MGIEAIFYPKYSVTYRMYSDSQAWANSEDPNETPQNLHCLPLIQQFLDTTPGSKLYLFNCRTSMVRIWCVTSNLAPHWLLMSACLKLRINSRVAINEFQVSDYYTFHTMEYFNVFLSFFLSFFFQIHGNPVCSIKSPLAFSWISLTLVSMH